MTKYNHNKYNLSEGQEVILDKGYRNQSKVVILSMTPNKLFSTIYPIEMKNLPVKESWDVMTNRLSPLDI